MNRLTTMALAGALLALAGTARADNTAQCITPQLNQTVAQGSICVSPQLPYDVDLSKAVGTNDKRLAFNIWSWNTFLALNWPVSDQRGQPDTTKTLASPGARVWESYKTTPETFPTPPAIPTPWNSPIPGPAPSANCPAPPDGFKSSGWLSVLVRANKNDDPSLSAVTQPMSGKFGHLIDQNGNYAFIDVMANQQSYDFVLNNKFYDADVQAASSQAQMLFPSGDIASKAAAPINVKPSWKILAGNDDPSKFYARPAYVIDPDTQKCTIQNVGLVGFHLTAKTTNAPQWIWATFEHKDNAPDCSYPNGASAGCVPVATQASYSFFNPACKTSCGLNVLPTSMNDRKPVQVARIIPIPDDVARLNAFAADLLKGTVWANYILVDTQFPQNPTMLYGNPIPVALANTTLETYSQGVSPLTQTSSCLGCHFMAPAAGIKPGTVFSDFDWQFHKAQSYSGKR